uniref:Uncharacterized protein n=1 Tax=Timema shepardi TaxID=629360 RepID=A0A7R9AXS9_TIMSH|nr:unnamed protein product [Timema shepardi]
MLAKETGITVLLLNLLYDLYRSWNAIRRSVLEVRWNEDTLHLSRRAAKLLMSSNLVDYTLYCPALHFLSLSVLGKVCLRPLLITRQPASQLFKQTSNSANLMAGSTSLWTVGTVVSRACEHNPVVGEIGEVDTGEFEGVEEVTEQVMDPLCVNMGRWEGMSLLLMLRLALLQGSLPKFSNQDNPAAFHPCRHVR